MEIILSIIKIYSVLLLLRYVMSPQELVFNSLGRGIAKLTNPIFNLLKLPKSSEAVVIPSVVIALFLGYGLIRSVALSSPVIFEIILALQSMLNFLTLFFIVCVVLGSITAPSYGGLPLYIFRLGKLWVKPVHNFTKIRANKAVIPALILLIILNALLWGGLGLFIFNHEALPILIVQNLGINILVAILHYLVFLIIVRALLSWFNPDPRNMLVQLVYYITEPVLSPMRRIIPPIGMLDLSAFIAIIVLGIMAGALKQFFALM
ncbi:MAG: YggT family protein [Deferribacteraceae bacterium]|nr:YggT family protein [Deferribacteraceae bacterium]